MTSQSIVAGCSGFLEFHRHRPGSSVTKRELGAWGEEQDRTPASGLEVAGPRLYSAAGQFRVRRGRTGWAGSRSKQPGPKGAPRFNQTL